MAQGAVAIKRSSLNNKRKTGVFAKTKTSKNKKSTNYKKIYVGQGR